MRAVLLCLFLAVGAMAQQKDVSFRQVVGGSFSGFSEDEKAEKVWEATAKFMHPAAEPGVWDMDVIKVQSLRGGKPWAVFTSPNGTMVPARRSAEGKGVVQSSSPAYNLTGKGWSWRSTPKGDTFAILADVVAELDLARPLSRRLRLRAPRMDASPTEGGTLMVFQGGVVAERFGERTTCERLECLVADGPGGEATCRSVAASGRVVRVLDKQTLRGDRATFDPKDDSAELVGHVELEEPEFKGSAQRLRHQPKQGLTQLFAGDGRQVNLRQQRKQQEPADLAGELITIHRDVAAGVSQVEVQENASYVSALSHLNARRLVATEARDGSSLLVGEGGVKGRLEGNTFEAGKARWNRAKRVLDLEGSPHIREARGLEAAGFSIRTDALNDRIEVRSGPGVRAAIHLPAGEVGVAAGVAEANQVVVVTEDGAMQAEMLGAVRYVSGQIITESDQMVAFATPNPKKKTDYELNKAILSGHVRYAQPGLRCVAERIDLTPSVQIEEVLTKDALSGRPRLLTLSGGAGPTRPRLFMTSTGGKNVEFVADAHEVLTSPELTKFFLRGAVAMTTEGTEATCDLLEGMAAPDKVGHLVARQVVGRGNVVVVASGSTAKGRTLEMQPEKGSARLIGDARIVDKLGNEGVPAKEVTYDLATRAWRMESAPDDANPGQVVRPKIFLGRDFTLPEVKNLDNGR
jgi:lipopolysaccharide export system protein LptA